MRLPVSAILFAFSVSACGTASPPSAETSRTRDARSEAYCIRIAGDSGSYDVDRALECRREEGAAAARAALMEIPAEIDRLCEAIANSGPQLQDFSWLAYMECVGPRLP